jgi:hypothetical protein
MLELLDTHPAIQVLDSEYARLLGFPEHHELSGRSLELSQWARNWYADHGRPWVYARETEPLNLANGSLRIHGREFASRRLRDQFMQAGAGAGVLVIVSAGRECEDHARQLWAEEKPDEYFFLEIFGSAVVEHLITFTGARICAWAEPKGLAVLPHYSPGYSGWDVSDQVKLFELLKNGHGQPFPQDIQVRDSGMIQPKKSLLALFGLTPHRDRIQSIRDLVPCENCSYPNCQYRRVPFKQSLPQIEDVRRLQSPAPAQSATLNSGLNPNAKYSLNSRALQKWSRERLRLEPLEDRSLEALFRFEGTTCTNLGQPLEFHYRLKLGPPEQAYPILAASCTPAPWDTGHAKMCAWLEDSAKLTRSLETEKPLLGQPLDAVLSWQRSHSPSGCYCDADARLHKWGLVLEVIHYALVQREKEHIA